MTIVKAIPPSERLGQEHLRPGDLEARVRQADLTVNRIYWSPLRRPATISTIPAIWIRW